MKKAFSILAAFVLAATSFQANADIFNIGGVRTKIYSFSNKSFDGAEQEERAMPLITEISNNGPLNVVYIESEESKVIVKGDKELFCRVQTQYKDGTVGIQLEAGTYRNLWLQVVVYAPKLNAIKCTGSGNIKAEKITSVAQEMGIKVTGSATIDINQLECQNDLDLHITGSGDIRIKQTSCRDLDINITGSGDVMAQQTKCANLDTKVGGSGGVKFDNITSGNATLGVTGSGNIKINEGELSTIKARVTGSGEIFGNVKCDSMDQKTTGSGSIHLNRK